VIVGWVNVGDASAASTPSPSHSAVTPAEVTPFHVSVAICFCVEIARIGSAIPELVRMTVGSSVNGTRYGLLPHAGLGVGSGHFCLTLHLFHRCRPDYIFSSSTCGYAVRRVLLELPRV
jgi:hypothetical protein